MNEQAVNYRSSVITVHKIAELNKEDQSGC